MDHKKRLTKYSQVKPAPRPTKQRPVSSSTIPHNESPKRTKLHTLRVLKHKTIKAANSVPLSKRSRLVIAIVMFVIITCIVVGIVTRDTSGNQQGSRGSGQLLENLEYQTILPGGKSITELGGWKRVSPPEGEAVYAYSDTLEGVAISISQQPLPDSFQGNTESSLEEMAKRFNATTPLDGGDTKAFIGASSKGPQSVIFTKNYLLILIKSQDTISDKAWTHYIKSLQ